MTLLAGRPGRRNPKQSMCQRFVIRENSKFSTFKHEPEVTKGRVGSQEFSVEGGVFLLCVGEFLRVESQKACTKKGDDDGSLLDVLWSSRDLIITFLKVELGENSRSCNSQGKIGDIWKRLAIRHSEDVQLLIITTRFPTAVLLLY